MRVLFSWLREFVDVPGSAEAVGRLLSTRGLALEGIERVPASALSPGADDDWVLDFEVTANRPDCLSVAGIAREVATAHGLPFAIPGTPAVPSGPAFAASEAAHGRPASAASEAVPGAFPIAIDAPDLCARYVGAVARVTPGPSPAWMQARLAACGVRPISNIVDITNYVLLELGHPMHAFDLDRLEGPRIVVRRARAGESLRTLDGRDRALTPDMLVIADAVRAQAVGGVMGGADSEVSDRTTRILFEAAWFEPRSVRATSKALGLRTEASIRFERGADPSAAIRAMARARELVEIVGAGRAEGAMVDCHPRPRAACEVALDRARLSGVLGMTVPDAEVTRILESLGFAPRLDGGRWVVSVPSWRVDIHRPVDLIEEIGRHHGFEHLPATFPGVQQAPGPSDPRIARDDRVRATLIAAGCSEAITFAFVDERAAEPFRAPADELVALANPLSEKFVAMRPSLLPGLVDAVGHNRRHQRRDVRLFEIGTRFSTRGESRGAAVAWTGLATPDHWSGHRREVDFFDLKGVVEQLGEAVGVAPAFEEARVPYLVEGQSAAVVAGGGAVGVVGRLAPELADARGLPAADAVYVAEVDLDRLAALAPAGATRAVALPRHPHVVRDLSILVADTLSAETVRGTIRAAAPPTLVLVREFDRYHGKGVPDGQVSLSLRLTFQAADRTLTDEEVQAGMQAIVSALAGDLKAVRR